MLHRLRLKKLEEKYKPKNLLLVVRFDEDNETIEEAREKALIQYNDHHKTNYTLRDFEDGDTIHVNIIIDDI